MCFIKRKFLVATIVVLLFLSVLAFVIGFVGVGYYASEKANVKTFRSSLCLVLAAEIHNDCTQDPDCNSTLISKCTTYLYDCFQTYWKVKFNTSVDQSSIAVIEGSQTRYYENALHELELYQIGWVYPCYYDSTDFNQVRWKFPNPTPYMILWVLCFSFTFISTLTIAFLYVTRFAAVNPHTAGREYNQLHTMEEYELAIENDPEEIEEGDQIAEYSN